MSPVPPSIARPLATQSPPATPAIPAPAMPGAAGSPRDDGDVGAGEGDPEARRDAHLVVRVGDERFALPLGSVAEGVEAPVLLGVAGVSGQWLGLIEWRGRHIPLGGAGAPFGRDAALPCAAALILDDPVQPLALAVDELCDALLLPPSAMRPFIGRNDPHAVVRSVAWDDDGLVAVVSTSAVREAMLAAASSLPSLPSLPSSRPGAPLGVPTGGAA